MLDSRKNVFHEKNNFKDVTNKKTAFSAIIYIWSTTVVVLSK